MEVSGPELGSYISWVVLLMNVFLRVGMLEAMMSALLWCLHCVCCMV